MTAQTHTPGDPSSEKPIERRSRWENSKVPERRCTAHKPMATGAGIRQSTVELSADITAEMHPPLRPKLDYVWKWLLIVLRANYLT